MNRPRASRVFYGWYVVAAAFAVTFVGFGSAYTFSAFVEPLQREFAASRGAIALVFSLAGFLYFGFGVVSGPLADRFGSRRLAVAGMLLTAAGLAAAGAARTLLQVYVAYGLGVGFGVGCAYVPAVGAVQRWFVRRRGFASGLAVAGIGVGTLAMPPLASALIAHVGWRGAYFALAALAAAFGAGMSLLIESDPRGRGLRPDGDPVSDAAAPAAGVTAARAVRASMPAGATVGEAIRSRAFASLYAACLVCSFGVFVPFVHLVPYAVDHGVKPAAAVLLLGAIGVGSTAGRFFLGGLADRLGRRASLLAMFAGMAIALVGWAGARDFAALAAFALVFGVFYGGWVAVLPAVVMDSFGGRNVSGIIGVLYTSVAFGTLIGPAAAGFVYDAGGGYLVPILASAAANAIAFAIVTVTGRTPALVRAPGE
ncbi:MFS transporter [Burkholderia humptydooensis]|uniref:MFS transporter n=2 Tax=Burkholderia humptydooensis TaxID=430531 RepID=A0A7U4SQI7_9BURK|nr:MULTISPECIES: MFS transporter [Burkholderia]AJY41418.1 major Facilitator Superfamily protein [Burkholderia sp. 2002721687]ALX41376.1 MFS transporter permease [Burkholderia humptydooensis]EIP84950.1 major facilitator superfamily MFS_1 [Burkholderia humptydooensis MSMB43]QPS43462.1 MFS transporter [Burkholderia humptydooensis]